MQLLCTKPSIQGRHNQTFNIALKVQRLHCARPVANLMEGLRSYLTTLVSYSRKYQYDYKYVNYERNADFEINHDTGLLAMDNKQVNFCAVNILT